MTDFFKEIDSITLLERNVSKLDGLEIVRAKRLIKMYKEAYREIKTRLMMAQTNTFTEAKLKSTIDQLEIGIKFLESKINSELKEGFNQFSENGAEDSAKEVNRFEKEFAGNPVLIPIDTVIESIDPENFLFNQYQSSISTYNNSLRQEFQRVLGQSLLQQKTWTQAVWDLDQVIDMEQWKLARIVRTELHGIYNVSKNKGFLNIRDEYLPDLKKTLYHPMDARTGEDSIAMSKANLIVDIDEPFVFTFKNKTYKFFTPPNRPNDRAILIPYRQEYGV